MTNNCQEKGINSDFLDDENLSEILKSVTICPKVVMETLPPPISKETFEERMKEWLKIVASGESGSILFFPKTDRLRRLPQLLGDKILLKRYLRNFQRYIFMILDLDLFPIEELEDLKEFTANQLNNLQLGRTYPKFSHWLEFFKKGDFRLVLIVVNAEKFLETPFYSVLFLLVKLVEEDPNIQTLLFFEKDMLHPQNLNIISTRTVILQNLLYYPLYSKKDVSRFVFYLGRKWNLKISPKLTDDIIDNCGGHFWLVKEAVRYFRRSRETKNILDHEEMKFRLEGIYNSFLESEKSLLRKIVFAQTDFDDLERHSLSHLTRLNLIDRNGHLTIKLLEKYIKNLEGKRPNIVVSNGNLLLNSVPIQTFFSRKELRVLKGFIQNEERVVTRDTVASWIWPTNTQEHYSDWAIDQLIARLRKRLTKLFITKESLKTIRGRGYLLSFSRKL